MPGATRSGHFTRHRRRFPRSPTRTQKLSSCTPTILGGRLPGKIGNANTKAPFERVGLFLCLGTCGRVHLFPVAVPGATRSGRFIRHRRRFPRSPVAVPGALLAANGFVAHRPLPLARVASSATGGASLAPQPEHRSSTKRSGISFT